MADTKISALTSATLPLAGTEVLPIVQSSTTKKVATDDLTVKNVRSNATTGILQIAGPAAGTTRVMTTPNANFTAARTDAAQSFTGDQTLSTGSLILGTAGKGADFSANSTAAGKTSTLLNWYEEGTWTPRPVPGSGTITTYTSAGRYTRVGRLVNVSFVVTISNVGTGVGLLYVTDLPYTSAAGTALPVGAAREQNLTGLMWSLTVGASTTSISTFRYDNANPIANNFSLTGSVTYSV